MPEIYALTDPSDGAIRYIGKANDAAKRLKGHIRDSRRRRTPVYDWINALAAKGMLPGLTVLSTCTDTEWEAEEVKAIAAARRAGYRLLNVALGGDQPFCPPEVLSANGRKSAQSRDKRMWALKRDLGRLLKEGYVNEATRAKMRARPDVFGQFAEHL